MYKLKTSSSITKRFKQTSNNRLLRRKACRNHLLQKKSGSKKQKMRKVAILNYNDYINLKGKLPHIKFEKTEN